MNQVMLNSFVIALEGLNNNSKFIDYGFLGPTVVQHRRLELVGKEEKAKVGLSRVCDLKDIDSFTVTDGEVILYSEVGPMFLTPNGIEFNH